MHPCITNRRRIRGERGRGGFRRVHVREGELNQTCLIARPLFGLLEPVTDV